MSIRNLLPHKSSVNSKALCVLLSLNSPRVLSDLCGSAVIGFRTFLTAEAPSTLRTRREKPQNRWTNLPSDGTPSAFKMNSM